MTTTTTKKKKKKMKRRRQLNDERARAACAHSHPFQFRHRRLAAAAPLPLVSAAAAFSSRARRWLAARPRRPCARVAAWARRVICMMCMEQVSKRKIPKLQATTKTTTTTSLSVRVDTNTCTCTCKNTNTNINNIPATMLEPSARRCSPCSPPRGNGPPGRPRSVRKECGAGRSRGRTGARVRSCRHGPCNRLLWSACPQQLNHRRYCRPLSPSTSIVGS